MKVMTSQIPCSRLYFNFDTENIFRVYEELANLSSVKSKTTDEVLFSESKDKQFLLLKWPWKKPKCLKTNCGRNICLCKTGEVRQICEEIICIISGI